MLNPAETGCLNSLNTMRSIGPIEVVVYNLGAQIGDRVLEDTGYKAFKMSR